MSILKGNFTYNKSTLNSSCLSGLKSKINLTATPLFGSVI